MAVYTFNFKNVKPSTGGGGRQPYIKPGKYHMKVSAYSDKASQQGKEMHTFTFTVMGKGPEAGKTNIDRFAMPKTSKESQFPVERLLAFFMSLGSKKAQGNAQLKLDPAKLVGKEFDCLIGDVLEDARTVDGTTYPARTVSQVTKYIFDGDEEDEDADDDDDDSDDEEEEDEEEDEDEESDDEDDDSDEDDEDEDEDDEEDEEEEEEPAPKKKAKAKPAAAPAKKSKSKPEAPAKKAKSKKSSDDFPFD